MTKRKKPDPTTSDTPREWLTPVEAAHHARVSRGKIYRAVKEGHLHALRIPDSRQLLFRTEWINAWLLTGEIPAGSPPTKPPRTKPPR